MTDQERAHLLEVLAKQKQFHQANPDEANAFLARTGIYTEDGQLTPEYGGKQSKSKR